MLLNSTNSPPPNAYSAKSSSLAYARTVAALADLHSVELKAHSGHLAPVTIGKEEKNLSQFEVLLKDPTMIAIACANEKRASALTDTLS